MSVPPPPKPPPPPQEKSGTWLGFVLSLLLLGGVIAGLSFLSLGSFLGVVILALVVLPALVLFHYLLWGWWLGRLIQQQAEEEE